MICFFFRSRDVNDVKFMSNIFTFFLLSTFIIICALYQPVKNY